MYRLLLSELNIRHQHDNYHDHYHGPEWPEEEQIEKEIERRSSAESTNAGARTRARTSSEEENHHAEHRRKPPIPHGREARSKHVPSIHKPSSHHPPPPPSPTPIGGPPVLVLPPTDDVPEPAPPKPIAIAKGPAATMRRINMQRTGTTEEIPQEQGYAYDEAYAEMQRLTPSQREIVKATFPAMEADAIRSALQVLLLLFSEHPRYKNIWPQFRAIPDSALMSAVELRRHASVYMKGLRAIIDAMDDEISLAEQLKRIARAHIKWNIHKAHVMHMLLPVLEVLSKALNQRPLSPEIADAWTTLYDVIANLIDIFREVERRASLSKPAIRRTSNSSN
ncbi:glb-14 [Pristionchus pacificus]|uniref:Glb-14 n=1 Tax=Pristionchus pacificus TaxID=54126 RepID=A0A2A6BHW3_PRIPA|nr:glb-14 [Pristionchus pacificus]|eukprot:PDM65500.1 glb-14 [Pristionchus pacificus]